MHREVVHKFYQIYVVRIHKFDKICVSLMQIFYEMEIPRFYNDLDKLLPGNRVLILYGARRTGKTTLLNHWLTGSKYKYKLDSGDNIRIQQLMGSKDFKLLGEYASGYDLIAIDEAQQIPGIGTGLKILIDTFPKIKLIATGSSSFELSEKVGEPLTGRKKTLKLFPLAQMELRNILNPYELKEYLEEYLIFGSYPEIINEKTKEEKIEILDELVNSYLLKDILSLENIKSPNTLVDLLKLLAFQVGNQVSNNELAEKLGINVRTVMRYLDLLEKTYVIFRLTAYSNNLRNEISTKSKYYFYDNGIRNGVIMAYRSLEMRNDAGQLWENFIISERLKKREYTREYGNSYFWRNYMQQEIDYLEEKENKIEAFEIKWKKDKIKVPPDFIQKYAAAKVRLINQSNYLDFILK